MAAAPSSARLPRAIGVGCTDGLSPEKVQAKVERFLESSRLLLVIDEGQYLWPQGKRVVRHPEFINWLNTRCANRGVPVAVIATEAFAAQRRNVEQQTAWQSFQLRRRLRRVFPLPSVPTDEDLALVARKLLPEGTDPMIEYLAGYARLSQGYLQAIVDSVADARLIAEEAGRHRVLAADLKRAVKEYRAPSDAAQQRVFAPAPPGKKSSARMPIAESAQAPCTDDAGPAPAAGTEPIFAGRNSAAPVQSNVARPDELTVV